MSAGSDADRSRTMAVAWAGDPPLFVIVPADGFAPIYLTPADMADLARSVEWARTDFARRTCPGVHDPRQHRDGKPPWCRHCGRDRYGAQIVDIEETQ